MKDLSIVVPTLNEKDNMPELIKRIKGLELNCELIIADSNSKDGTREVAEEEAGKQKLDLKILNTGKLDLSNSAIFGFRKSNSKYVALMDADLQHPPEMIKILLEKIKSENADIVLASKYVRGSELKNSFGRLIISKGFIYMTYIFFPRLSKIKDPSSGFFIFRKNLIDGINLKPTGFRTLLEILVRAKPKKVIEIPFIFGERKKGKTKANLKQVKMHLIHLKRLVLEK